MKRANLIEFGAQGLSLYPFSWNKRTQVIVVGRDRQVPAADMPNFIKKESRALKQRKIFIKFSSDLALGMHETFLVSRPADSPIDEPELERIIAQAVTKFGDAGRTLAAEKLGVAASDIVFGNINIWKTVIDGHQILNPLGCRGVNFEVQLGGSFIRQDAASAASAFSFDLSDATVAHIPLAYLFSELNKINQPALFVSVGTRETALLQIGPGKVFPYDSFAWGEANLVSGLEQKFSVNNQIARETRAVYNNKQPMSSFTFRSISHLIEAEYQLLLHGVKNAILRLPESAAHLYARGGAPDFIFNEQMENGHGKKVVINPISISNWSDECGYTLRVEDPEARFYAPEVAAEFIYRLRRPSDDLANTIAERHRRWLEPRA